MRYHDRYSAGRALAKPLDRYANRNDVIVLGLARGGVPVGYEIAKALGCALDVFLVRKLGVPWQQELAMGAIASGGVRILNDDIIDSLAISQPVIDATAEREQRELERRERLYRDGRAAPDLAGRTIILVDDGLATGASMRAAAAAVRTCGPRRVVVAVPVASVEAFEELSQEVDECVCGATPQPFFGVGYWYVDFSQTSDGEVQELLARSAVRNPHTVAH